MKTKTQKRPFYKAIEGTWSRVYLILLIVLVSMALQYSSPQLPTIEPSISTQMHRVADKPTGTVIFNMNVASAAYNITSIETGEMVVENAIGSQSFDLPAGKYRVVAKDLPGYTEPRPMVFVVQAGGNHVFNAKYGIEKGTPTLSVRVVPEEGKYRVFDSKNLQIAEGEGPENYSLPAGNYRIEFLDIPHYRSPGEEYFSLTEWVTTTIQSIYGR